MARQTPRAVYEPFKQPGAKGRICDAPGCQNQASHRAPVSRDNLDRFYWFCLDHVREYNQAWNYYEGMSEDEIEAHRRRDTVWQRPTWPLGQFGAHAFRYDIPIDDDLDELRNRANGGKNGRHGNAETGRPRTEREEALAILDLQEPITLTEIKVRYKSLVKKLHPDANGGDTRAEEQLKVINQAYAILKTSFA